MGSLRLAKILDEATRLVHMCDAFLSFGGGVVGRNLEDVLANRHRRDRSIVQDGPHRAFGFNTRLLNGVLRGGACEFGRSVCDKLI